MDNDDFYTDSNYDQLQSDLEDANIKDIKINPDFYTHLCYINAIECLKKDNIEQGLLAFRMNIETLETITRARGLLSTSEYDEAIKKEIAIIKQDNKDSEIIKQGKIANKKLELISEVIFKNKIITTPLLDK